MTSPPPVYNGRYELRGQIGRGGTAQVYLAHDLLLDRPVALKVLIPELSSDRSFVERFRREAQAAANLAHPNIVSVYDWGEAEHTYFIVMEFVDGEPLSSIIATQAPLRPTQAVSIAADIAKALSYAHRHGVVHRDVKPGNVLITSDGQIKVTDFGIARAIDSDDQVTQTGLVMGTATYFSPEQAQGLGVDGRSDVYALGVVLYEMVVGRPPFQGDSPVSIAYQHVREDAPKPSSLNPSVPPALEAIIGQAMAKLPAQRYESAEDFRADLERFAHGQAVLARPPGGLAATQINEAVETSPSPQDTSVVATVPVERVPTTTSRWIAAGILLFIALFLVVFFGGRTLGYFGGAPYIRVPNVMHLPKELAASKLQTTGLQTSFKSVPYASVSVAGYQSGEVYRQKPSYPSSARRGDTVLLYIIAPPTTAPVPTVTQLSLKDAQAALKKAGFQSSLQVIVDANPNVKPDTVINQVPAAGVSKQKGTVVVLQYVKPIIEVMVPSLVGDTPAIAGNLLGSANLKLGVVRNVFSTVTVGNVVSSLPPALTKVPPGTVVNIYISRGPGGTVPNITDLPVDQALQTLQTDGFTANPTIVYQTPPNPNLAGIVLSQFPMAGKAASAAHPITLYVGSIDIGTTTTPTTIPTTTPTTYPTLPGGNAP